MKHEEEMFHNVCSDGVNGAHQPKGDSPFG